MELWCRKMALLFYWSWILFGALGSCTPVSAHNVTCLTSSMKPLNIECPKGKVIVRPKVKVGKMAAGRKHNSLCYQDEDKDCLGSTPEILAQTNDCHFRQVCNIQLNPHMPITNTDSRECLAKRPDYVTLESHECLCQKSIVYVCDKGTPRKSIVFDKEGTIVSHRYYPWHYSKRADICELYVPLQLGHKLHIWTEDIDLDPNGHDKLALYRVISSEKQTILGDPKHFSIHGINMTFTSCHFYIRFSVEEASKAGRGFLMKYKWFPVEENQDLPATSKVNCTGNGVEGDATVDRKHRKRHRNKNRKRKGRGDKNKHRGRKKNRGHKRTRKNKRRNKKKSRKST